MKKIPLEHTGKKVKNSKTDDSSASKIETELQVFTERAIRVINDPDKYSNAEIFAIVHGLRGGAMNGLLKIVNERKRKKRGKN